MKLRPVIFTLFSLTMGATLAVVSAQVPKTTPAGASKAPVAPTKEQSGNVIIRNSLQGTGVYDDKTQISRLTKDVTVVQTGEDFILYAQDLTYNDIPDFRRTLVGSRRSERIFGAQPGR